MPEGDPHPSTLSVFRGTRDPERSVTHSRSGGRKSGWNLKMFNPRYTKPNQRYLPAEVYYPTPRQSRSHLFHGKGTHVLVLRVFWGWSPYSQGIDYHMGTLVRFYSTETEDVLNAKLLSRKRIPLQVPNGNCEYYLGDRCGGRVCAGRTRIQEVEEELSIARRQIDSIDHQLYAYDLQLRRGRDVRVASLPPGGGTRTRQRRSGP
ncbi:hypothetical protein GIB67_012227 [Kingdonia uniflora]|uniref:Uncharacterized protein n=1 Tax=Kingdonia uniflora TaxID=39325 RepID=A0A7J7LGB0_9MAGN|nr:hypothetical protein GIB67_012227 [Kingdonia uniflora]